MYVFVRVSDIKTAHRRKPESKIKIVPRETYVMCLYVNTNSYIWMTLTLLTDGNQESKKNIVPRWNFLFTLTHDLSAPPTLRFFRFAQKTPLARNNLKQLLVAMQLLGTNWTPIWRKNE